MEKIYNPSYFLSSDHINIKKYFEKFKKSLDEENIFNQSTKDKKTNDSAPYEEFSNAFEIAGVNWSEKEKECLAKCCDISNLELDIEHEPLDTGNLSFFKTINHYQPYDTTGAEHLKSIQAMKSRENANIQRNNLHLDIAPPTDKGKKIDLVPGEEIIVHISIYRPFKYTYAENYKHRSILKFFKEITLLGSNTLADFRDIFNCPSDAAICKEISDNPDFVHDYISAKEVYPSGFIFIDGVFYNDLREDNAIDYSEVIRNWAVSKNIGNFQVAEMESTRIDSLSPRLGYPYLYQHKGCCEHILMFTHMRLLNSNDTLVSTNYPYFNGMARIRDRYCIICGANSANWLVVDCDRLPQSKATLCTQCFKSYNYIGDQKIGNFKAYPFCNNGSGI